MNTSPLELAIVVPCYNEEQVLPETARQLLALLDELTETGKIAPKSRIYFVDDGSRDQTWPLIETLSADDGRVHGIKLSYNRGHQHALLAGLFTAEGDIIISIDADLQDDIQVIGQMIDAYREGNDVVYGVRAARKTDRLFKRVTAESFYRLLGWMGVDVVFNHADYRLMSRRAIEALKGYGEVNVFLRGIIPSIGFPSTSVSYDRNKRIAGESKYPLSKMIGFAINGITAFSSLPLRLIAVLGFVIFLFSLLLSIWVLWVKIFAGEAIPGWASSVLPMYLLGGIQLLSIGVLGEYVGRIYMETKRRPRFIIEKII
jgi:glycosyltransferase involved in cell wall biosynthesis